MTFTFGEEKLTQKPMQKRAKANTEFYLNEKFLRLQNVHISVIYGLVD